MRHTISVLVENKFGVLTRVSGLFSGRGYNIDSLNVAPTHDATLSRMTIVTRGDDATVEQICKQLEKLIDSVKIVNYSKTDYIDRELVLVRVSANGQNRAEICQLAELFRAKVVNVEPDNIVIEITGAETKINQFLFEQIFEFVARMNQVLLDRLTQPPIRTFENDPNSPRVNFQPVLRWCTAVLGLTLKSLGRHIYLLEDSSRN
jgi:acetolactate synthase-1/3 small subunit